MKETLKSLYYACREICLGSGRISILSIVITTLVVYTLFFVTGNQQILSLLIGTTSKESFPSAQSYLQFLESVGSINELHILIPILSTIILLIPPTSQLKANVLNKLLPIAAWQKTMAFMLIILSCTILSLCLVQLLDYGITQYIRVKYLPEVITLQESFGELYKNKVSRGSIFSADNNQFSDYSKHIRAIITLSLVFNTILLVTNLLFNKHSIIKGVGLIILTLFIAVNIRTALLKNGDQTMHLNSFTYETVYFIYFPVIFMLFLFAFYFLLKQKES